MYRLAIAMDAGHTFFLFQLDGNSTAMAWQAVVVAQRRRQCEHARRRAILKHGLASTLLLNCRQGEPSACASAWPCASVGNTGHWLLCALVLTHLRFACIRRVFFSRSCLPSTCFLLCTTFD